MNIIFYSIINDQNGLFAVPLLSFPVTNAIMNVHHFPSAHCCYALHAHSFVCIFFLHLPARCVDSHPSIFRNPVYGLVHHREVPAEQSEHLHLVSLIAVHAAVFPLPHLKRVTINMRPAQLQALALV
ncbi:hypothetical protein KZX70_29605 [Paenibacillus silvae]|uniref:hypothetical protein n=1 Tax=Paenibacillus silvae TaxID=1325358 RepID=UPI002003AF63|nr:hypothetical protein [Paenibacillus silvae]MCK6078984.1 hypothetical protein [Paenibacillus silvae]MCK6153303.1 hypothetical protein [Paenibacillus silvae]MCK6271381.1 hypothetical protein [Paenibacillus silvae]